MNARWAVVVLGLLGPLAPLAPLQETAAGAPHRPAPAAAAATPPPPVWIGVFDPQLPVHPPWTNTALTPVAHAGVVRVLTPATGPTATGDVIVVHPLLGKLAAGKVEKGMVALATFAYDERDSDDAVLVLPGGTPVAFVAATRTELAAITSRLVKTDAIAGVRRALAGIEVGAIDIDGDGKADLASTYGCTAWFDGSCQSKGQFMLARRGPRWTLLE